MYVNQMNLPNLSVSPQELLKLPLFSHMSLSGIYYKYHTIKRHVHRPKHLSLRVIDLSIYLDESSDRVGEWLGYTDHKLVG